MISCKQCLIGEFSFSDGMMTKNCQRCPANSASCYLDKINVKEGFI